MNLKALRNVVTSKASMKVLMARKHSPAILFAAGIIGVTATVVLACRATLKLEEVLEEAKDDLEIVRSAERISDDERAQAITFLYIRTGARIVKLYGPAAILGAASIAAITGSHVILNRRNVALTAAYATIDKAFKRYRSRVVEELGEEKDREFQYCLADQELDEGDNKKVVRKRLTADSASGYARFFDEGSRSWNKNPGYNWMFIKCQQKFANERLQAEGFLFLNDVYEMLGLKRTHEGQVVGWLRDDQGGTDGFIDFGINDGSNPAVRDFANGWSDAILLDFNVDGVVWDKF